MKFFDFVFAEKIFQYTSESMPMVINDIQLELLRHWPSSHIEESKSFHCVKVFDMVLLNHP